MIDLFGATIVGPRAGLIALDVALKATALLLLTFGFDLILGRRRALIRSALWNACLIGLLLIPAADLTLPRLIITIPAEQPVASEAAAVPVAQLPSLPPSEAAPPPLPTVPDTIDRLTAPAFAPAPALSSGPATSVAAVPRLGGVDIAFAAYLLGVALLAIRLAGACLGIARLRREGVRIEDAAWIEPLARRRSELNIKARVDLLASDRISVPIVVGCWNPAVVVPSTLLTTTDPVLIDAILLHELGHIRRRDFGWNLLRNVVQMLYWPHPLVWPIGRIIERVREQACDDLCVYGLGGAEAYRASLIEVASQLIQRPDSALGLAMARSSNLGLRLAWIDRTRGASNCLLRWPGRASLALAATIAAGVIGSIEFARSTGNAATEPPQEQKAKPTPDQPDAIEITVRARDTGKSLEGATVRASIDMQTRDFKTDREGVLRIDLSKRMFQDSLSFDVWADGYVQQRYFFSQLDSRSPKIPARFAVELLPGEETLGGKVVDEQGKPIAGVTVAIWGYLGSKKQKEELAYMVDTTTDAQGQWRCRSFRSMTFANLYLTHPDFLSDGSMNARAHGRPRPSDPASPGEKAMSALRDFSDVQVMSRGVSVAGQVVDEQGKPIAGAEVGWLGANETSTFHDDLPLTATDEAGRFRFPHARPGGLVLQVKAKGHAPELKQIVAKDGLEPVVITLGKPRTIEGRVVDSKGKPIPDAFIVVDTWRTYRALGVFLKSAADGSFRWDDAPQETVLMNATRTGYEYASMKPVGPGEKALFTLKRSLSLSGMVRDAKTNKRIESPTVELGTPDPKTGAYTWAAENNIFASQGRLQANVDVERTPEFRLRIRAKGYEPFETQTFRVGEVPSDLEIKLNPTDKPDGVVLSGEVRRPDGTPLAGAEVAVTYPMAGRNRLPSVNVQDGTIEANERVQPVKTDAAGRFQVVREPDPGGRFFGVVVVHPQFYAEAGRAAFEADPKIVAQPWSRVEGVARVGQKPAAGVAIEHYADRIGNPEVPNVSHGGKTTADDQGRFVLERVAPGDVRVVARPADKAAPSASASVLLELKPGETGRAELGGKGRPVIARIAIPPGFDPKGDYAAYSQIQLASDRERIPYPRELFKKRDGSLVAWGRTWWNSEEGHAYRRSFIEIFQADLRPDGTIRIEDVPPGQYRLSLTYSADPLRGITSSPERIGHATKQFTVPEIPGGRSDVPFDLGTLHPKPRQVLKVGQAAPEFDIETLDGRRVKLSDYRGKFLLLDFWATWCGPCVAEIPELKAVHERFKDDKRFAMLSLSLDAEKEAPRKFVAEKSMAWTQGFLGESAEGGVADRYHVQAIPATFLIAPDGTVKAIGPRGNSIGAAISEALK